MKNLSSSFLYILFLAFCACHEEEDKPALQGCCETPAIDAAFGNGHVYVPNIFTPNNDGINDVLFVLGDSVQQVINFEVKNSAGESVFHAENIPLWDDLGEWDGRVNGVVVKGLYSIALTLMAEDGTIATFTGKTCNYPCGSVEESEMVDGTGCQYPVQSDNGHYNPSFPSGEQSDCYK